MFRKVTTKGMLNAIHALEALAPLGGPTGRESGAEFVISAAGESLCPSPASWSAAGAARARYCSEACQIANWGITRSAASATARRLARLEGGAVRAGNIWLSTFNIALCSRGRFLLESVAASPGSGREGEAK